MSRVFGSQAANTNYEVQIRKPYDARMLVPSYEDLLDKTNWLKQGTTNQIIAYNGMIVSVSNTTDTSKNGLYRLFDPDCTTALKSPNVENAENWIKISDEATAYIQAETLSRQAQNIAIDQSKVYTNTQISTIREDTYSKDQVDARLDIIADQIETLSETIVNTDNLQTSLDEIISIVSEGTSDDITSLEALIERVVENSDSIVNVSTITNSHTGKLEEIDQTLTHITSQMSAIVQPKSSEEVSVDSDGTITINKITMDKVDFGEGLILDGGTPPSSV